MRTWSQSCDWQSETLFVLISWQVLLLTDRVGKSDWSPCGRRKHTSSAGEQTSTQHRRSPLGERRLFSLVLPQFFYHSSSVSQCSVSTVIPVVSSSPGVSDWGKQCLFLLEMADELPLCRRTTFVSLSLKKRARRRFIDRPWCHFFPPCAVWIHNETLKQKKFFLLPVQWEERSKRNCESLGAHIIHLGSQMMGTDRESLFSLVPE